MSATSLIAVLKMDEIPFLETGLEGFLSKHAVEIHVKKHHQAYIDNGNKLLQNVSTSFKSVEEIVHESNGALFNNAAQHYNHQFFWHCLTNENISVSPLVEGFINKTFGSFEKFKEEFVSKSMTVFGSGWVYLTKNADSTVSINQYSNAQNPVKENRFPILCVDTWEHAWYIDYENRKAEYFNAFFNKINWNFVEERLNEAGLLGEEEL